MATNASLLPDSAEAQQREEESRNKWFGWLGTKSKIAIVVVSLTLVIMGLSKSRTATKPSAGELVLENISEYLPHRPEEARKATQVSNKSVLPGVTSYSGFATVNETAKDHLFWWFLEAEKVESDTKLLIWLQGGPGASSLFGMFTELGPIFIDEDGPAKRPVHWGSNNHLLFIDNPVGVGFSFSETDHFVTSSEQAGTNLVTLLDQFYKVFPEMLNYDLYLTGESFAGHYVPAFGSALAKAIANNKENATSIPFKGVALGNAWVDPVEQLSGYAEVLYGLGLIENVERDHVENMTKTAIDFIKGGFPEKAYKVWDNMISGDESKESYFHRVTGLTNYFNYLPDAKPDPEFFAKWLNQTDVRRAIHVGNRTYQSTNNKVELALEFDVMRSYRPELEFLLSRGYKALVYNGQLDIIVNYGLTRKYLQKLDYEKKRVYTESLQTIWGNGETVYGYVKSAGNLTTALVRGCGHMVPAEQPEAAFDLITRFTRDLTFNNKPMRLN